MNLKLIIIIRYLLAQPARTLLVIMALLIGLWGVGFSAVAYYILHDDLNQNYLKTRPVHVAFRSDEFSNLDLNEFRQRKEIESAEFRGLAIERIEISPNHWVPIHLFGIESFERLQQAKFYPESGNKIPSTGTVLIERNGKAISNLKLDSSARIRVGGKKIVEAYVSGFTFDPGRAPSSMDHIIYGYTNSLSFETITGKKIYHRLIVRFNNGHNKEQIQKMTADILEYFAKSDINISEVSIPVPNEHPHQFQLNSIIALQGGIGLLAFLIGIILVWQLMGAILMNQVRQIGIYKAIGATGLHIFFIYTGMVVVLGVVASSIALPLSIWSGYTFARFISTILNFEVLTTSLPFELYFFLLAAGIVFPLLATFPVLFKSSKRKVIEALSEYGVRLEAVKESVWRLPVSSRWSMILRNNLRRKTRLMITLCTMALGVAIFNTGFNLKQALIELLDELDYSYQYDIHLSLHDPISRSEVLDIFSDIANVDHIETWSGGSGVLGAVDKLSTAKTTVVALPYNTGLMRWTLIQGRWLANSGELEIVANQRALEDFDKPEIGKKIVITVNGRSIVAKLVGIVKQFALPTIYVEKGVFDELVNPTQLVSNIMFVAKDKSYTKVLELRDEIELTIEPSNLNVAAVMSQMDLMKALFDHLNIILSMITLLALMVLIVSAIGMASAMGINIMERTKEIGVLRAIGATPKMIYGIVIGEGFVIVAVSAVVGIVLSLPISVAISAFFGELILRNALNFAFSQTGVVVTIVLTLVFGWVASSIPARRAIKRPTGQALNYE